MSIFDGQPDDNSALAGLNPGWMGMLGLAGGLGQGAMPSTHRGGIPFGAAMGMGAAGMGQGMANAYKMQQEQATAEGQRIQNAMTRPWVQMMQNPDAIVKWLQSSGGGAGGGGGAAAAPATSPLSSMPAVGGGYGPINAAGDSATRKASEGGPPAAGSPGAAVAQQVHDFWVGKGFSEPQVAGIMAGGPGNESDFNPTASGDKGTSIGLYQHHGPRAEGMRQFFNLPPGQMPNLDQQNQYAYWEITQGPLKNVGEMLKQAQTPAEAATIWTQHFGVPADKTEVGRRALGADRYMGVYGGQQQPYQVAQAGSGGVPSPAPGSAPPPSAPVGGGGMPQDTNGLFAMSKDMMDRANKMDMINMLPQPARVPALMAGGLQYQDAASLRTAAQQLRAAALAGPTERAKLLEQLQFSGPIELQKSLNKLDTDRYGNRYLGLTPLGRGSQVQKVWNPDTQQEEWKDVGALTAQQAASGGTGPGVAAAPPPTLEHFMTERGKDLAEQFHATDNAAANAKASNYLFDNMRNDAQSWGMGKFATIEGDARAWLSAASHAVGETFGVEALKKPEGLDKPLADYQAFLKSSGSLLRQAVHETSSRAAVQEYNMIGDTLPHPGTSEGAFHQVADQWQALNDFAIAKQKFAQGYQRHPQDFNVDWNGQVSPTTFLINRMSQSPQGQKDMHEMMARLSQTAEGRVAISHIQQQYRFARDNGLLEGLAPPAPSAGQP